MEPLWNLCGASVESLWSFCGTEARTGAGSQGRNRNRNRNLSGAARAPGRGACLQRRQASDRSALLGVRKRSAAGPQAVRSGSARGPLGVRSESAGCPSRVSKAGPQRVRRGPRAGRPPQVVRAIENLKLAMRMRLSRQPLNEQQAHAFAAVLDSAAQQLERI